MCVAASAMGDSYRKFSAGIFQPKEDIGERISSLLALIPGLEDGGDLIGPRHGHWRAGLVDDHRPGVGLDYSLNQAVLAAVVWQIHTLAIITF